MVVYFWWQAMTHLAESTGAYRGAICEACIRSAGQFFGVLVLWRGGCVALLLSFALFALVWLVLAPAVSLSVFWTPPWSPQGLKWVC